MNNLWKNSYLDPIREGKGGTVRKLPTKLPYPEPHSDQGCKVISSKLFVLDGVEIDLRQTSIYHGIRPRVRSLACQFFHLARKRYLHLPFRLH